MQDLLELLVQIKTTGLDSLDKAQGSLRNVSNEAKTGNVDFERFQSSINAFTKAGLTLREALEQLAAQSKLSGGTIRQMAVDALAADKEFTVLANNAEKLAVKQAAQAEKAAAQQERQAQRLEAANARANARAEAYAARQTQLANARAQAEEQATERIIRTLERRALASAAADRVQRLELERSFALGNSRNPAQASRINSSYDNLVQTELRQQEERAAARAKNLAERAATREATAAERAAASEFSALQRFGTMGATYAGGLPMFAGRSAFGAGLAGPLVGLAAGALAVGTVRSAAQESRETVNSASRLDLSVGQTRDLQNEAKLAGVGFNSLESAERTLSAALEDFNGNGRKASEALVKLGVDTVTSRGEVREMGPVLLDVIDKLADLPSKTERAAEGNRILGRGYKELEPLIEKHRELQGELQKYGLILDSNLINKLSESETKFAALGIAYDNFKAKLADKLEPVVIPLIVSLTGLFSGKGVIGGSGPAYNIEGGSPFGTGFGNLLDDLTGESRGAGRKAAAGDRLGEAPNPQTGTILDFLKNKDQSETSAARVAHGKFLSGQGDSEEKLRRNVEDAKKTYLDSVTEGSRVQAAKGAESEAFSKSTAEITKNKDAYDKLNASLKALEERKHDPKDVRRFIEGLDDKSEDPITKLFGKTEEFLKERPNLTRGERGNVSDATRNAANAILTEAQDKLEDEQDRTKNNFVKAGGQYDRSSERQYKEIFDGLARHDKDVTRDFLKNGKDTNEIDRINRQGDREETSAQSNRALRNIELNAGPGAGGQRRAADQAYSQRLAQAEQFKQKELDNLTDITTKRVDSARIEADYKKLLWQAEEQHETKILEIQHKRQQEADQFAGKIYDSLQRPGGFQQLVKGELNGIGRQVFTNITGPVLNGVGKSIGGSMPQGGNWEKLFKGTILEGTGAGKDSPTITAQERTTSAVHEVRDVLVAASTGKPIPGGAGGSGGAAAAATPGGAGAANTPGGAASLMAWLGIGGLAAASVNTIVNPPGFPGKKEIDTAGGITNPGTVNHGYQDSAHTGAAARIFSGSIGLTGAVIGGLTKLGQGRNAVYVDNSGNVVSGSGETSYEGNSLPGGSDGDFGGEVSNGGGIAAGGPAGASVAGSYSNANAPSASSGILGALGNGAKGGASISNFTGNLADAMDGGGSKAIAQTVGSGLALGGAVTAGVITAVQQFQSGGARGALGGTAAILGTAAALDPEPISKAILGASAMVTGIVKALLPDQKAQRAQQESEALTQNAYLAPPTINSTQSLSGNNVSYDKYGHAVETSPFAGFNVNQPYQVKDPYTGNYETIPGSVSNITPGTATPSSAAIANASQQGGGTSIALTVHALDSQNILDRSSDIGAAIFKELGNGGALGQRIQATVLGS